MNKQPEKKYISTPLYFKYCYCDFDGISQWILKVAIVINKPWSHIQHLRFNMMNLTYYFWPFWYLLKWLITGWIAQLSFWIQYKSHCQSKPSIIPPPVGVCISEGMKQNGDFVIFNYSRWLCLWLHYNIVAQFCLQWKKDAALSHCFSLETLPGPHQRSPPPFCHFPPSLFP